MTHRPDNHAGIFTNRTRAEVAEARARSKPSSWWTAYAAPNARAAFIDAAKVRHAAREQKRHALTLRVDAQ